MTEVSRTRVSFLAILVTVVVIGLLAALLLPMISDMREAGRRAQCMNHLRQLALAIREYHDVRDQLPPLATDEGHWTWAALVLPYSEEVSNLQPLDFLQPASVQANRASIEAFRLPAWYCPTRRADAQEPDTLRGQPTDYVAVSTTAQLRWSTTSNGPIVFRAAPPTREAPVRSVTSLAHITDGQSLTAMLGEKHMLRAWLWGQSDQPAMVAHNDQNTVRMASNIERKGETTIELPRGLAGDDDADADLYKFGGPHPEVCMFAMTDASVRPVKNSTDPRTLRWLCGRNDGEVVKLGD
jgi:type II secretory pathway pseudopilin PulG